MTLANGDTRLRSGLEQLYDLFQKAPELGSLINPRRLAHGDLVTASFSEIQPLLTKALQSEKARRNDDLNEIGVAAQGMAQAANVLGSHYHLTATNVPYLSRGKHSDTLKNFSDSQYPAGKSDLATVFLERTFELGATGDISAVVIPHNWLFLGSYKSLRKSLLEEREISLLCRLGAGAFETISGEVVNVVLLVTRNCEPCAGTCFRGVDCSNVPTPPHKADMLARASLQQIAQSLLLKAVDYRIMLDLPQQGHLLAEYAAGLHGQGTFDVPCFVFNFWELPELTDGWVPQQSTSESTQAYAGCTSVFRWENGCGMLARMMDAKKADGYSSGKWKAGIRAWGKPGVAVSGLGRLYFSLYLGQSFDANVSVVLPKDASLVPAIWAYALSGEFESEVRKIDKKFVVTCNTLVKIPFDESRWRAAATQMGPLSSPFSDNPTQWLFTGQPTGSTTPLQVGVARLLGYRWPRQTGQAVSGAPPVPEDGLEKFVDEDGIVCIPSVRGEAPAAERLRALLAAAYGKAWSPAKLDELLSSVDYAGSNVEDWLRNGFFDQHSKLFHHRPFVWQIWDGRKDGFSALVNYHKLDHKLLEKLTYTYLGEWIKKQREAVTNEESGADDRLVKAQQLQDKLKLILEGEAPYDIFVRWKPLEQHPIGWNPDLNDGVRLNIRPFMEADVLRKRPNIKWGIDRGKNPPGSPWGEERENDRHLTLEQRRKAR